MASSVKIDSTEVWAAWLPAQVAVPQDVYLEDHGTSYLLGGPSDIVSKVRSTASAVLRKHNYGCPVYDFMTLVTRTQDPSRLHCGRNVGHPVRTIIHSNNSNAKDCLKGYRQETLLSSSHDEESDER